MQNQSIAVQQRKFMCLEDRLLEALYQQDGTVSLTNLASPIAITTNAALSIVHRISSSHPDYILLNEDGGNDELLISPISTQTGNVQQFLDDGGFTRINELEFLQYYKKELKQEKRREMLKNFQEKIRRERWLIGIGLLIGSGLILSTYLYVKNGKDQER